MADEGVTYRLDVVVDLPEDRDIDDFIMYIEGTGMLGPDAKISVSDIDKQT